MAPARHAPAVRFGLGQSLNLALGGGELGLGVGSLPSFAEGATSKAAFRLAISLSFARLANGCGRGQGADMSAYLSRWDICAQPSGFCDPGLQPAKRVQPASAGAGQIPGRVGSAGRTRCRRQRPTHGTHRASLALPLEPIHPLKTLDPAPDGPRGVGQRFPIRVAVVRHAWGYGCATRSHGH